MKKTLLSLACMLASLPLLAGNNLAPMGWATCSDEAGTAFTMSGGNFSDASKITLKALGNGQNDDSQIKSAISKYDIIILDGSNGDFTIERVMQLASVKNKTIIGINNARLCTKFYLTEEDHAYLKKQNLEGLSSTAQITGTLPDGTTLTCDERAFYTKKAMMELQYQKTGVYSLPNRAGIFELDASVSNFIIRNLSLIGPGSVDIDGVDLITNMGQHVWVDHCTLVDSQDGALDSKRCDWSTYTYNKFYYTSRSYSHAYTCGCGWADGNMILHLTFAYNEWGEGCVRRLPQCGDCYVHLLNNYHNCPGNSAGMTINENCKALVEGNFAAKGVQNPLTGSGSGRSVTARGNNFAHANIGSEVTVPYQYNVMANTDVVANLTGAEGVGATLGNDADYILSTIPTAERQAASASLYFFDESFLETNAAGLSQMTFTDGATIVLNKSDKAFGKGASMAVGDDSYTSIKLSNGAENIFTAPAGKTVTGVKFYSYINKAEEDRVNFWSVVGDKTYTATSEDVQILNSRDASDPDVTTYSIAPAASFKFKNSGYQLSFVMEVTYGDATGISNVAAEAGKKGVNNDVYYNLLGQPVAPNTRGMIIYNGKKVIR
ncbi:MAG: hypothetical protein IKN75_00255 [Prevotella sp.]|nr:hypothetical protein [Prevotella sp.]